jgi:hypothetical protein
MMELQHGESLTFDLFTGEDESDPHRIAFYTVAVTTAGITLSLAHCPDPEAAEATWAELHGMLGAKEALLADIDHLKEEKAEIERELVSLRVQRRRYFAKIATMRATAEADAAGRADGTIVPLLEATAQ